MGTETQTTLHGVPCVRFPYACSQRRSRPIDFAHRRTYVDRLLLQSAMRETESKGRFCSRLQLINYFQVPLDYTRPDDASAAIALIRSPSAVTHDSPSYRGPVLINPGGPGGSGVDTVAAAGPLLSTIIGPEFDIIGFDPRGAPSCFLYSTRVYMNRPPQASAAPPPRISFFASRAERQIWSVEGASIFSVNSSADALARGWARGVVLGQLAGKRDDGSLRFMTTDHTARDMLKIVQAHGRNKLQYWGFSYVHSSYVAPRSRSDLLSMANMEASWEPRSLRCFRKMSAVLSSTVIQALILPQPNGPKNLLDADKTWKTFINGCVAAGPTGCALYAPTAAEIIEKVDKIYASVRERPIPVRTDTSSGLVDWTTVRSANFFSLYAPYTHFSLMARALADLYERNGTMMFKIFEKHAFQCVCDPAQYQFELLPYASSGIICNDGERISPEYEDLVEHHKRLSDTSSWADVWGRARMSCLAWPDFPKNHFQGPFVANTSFPLLLVGNTMDPVTPLWAFCGVRCLDLRLAWGACGCCFSSLTYTPTSQHCSTASVSLCTLKYIRQYFVDRTLPESGTVCPVDIPLFPPGPSTDVADEDQAQVRFSNTLSAADRRLFEAGKELVEMSRICLPRGN
ncbi:Abhydrolase-4 domain-containing protein [Mycena sanguinolenta]|uniref:Abhydrolase-4 domain-containing protein n=1 Tax=Mycena sanguinolenta TaxID=230812 RepID=A0A8H6Z3P8_9AGAR|nr:Abhydrolase-4 domain-containing protein [Mycena sanguinolenta]